MHVSRETWDELDVYAAMIRKWNARINLVAPSSAPHLQERHIADSLQLVELSQPDAGLWADLGSGGGFPGLVAAIAAAAGGDGWVNVEPQVDDDQRIEVPGIFAWFSARGPQVPVGTFVPGNDRDPASVGLDHGTGRGAGDRLVAAGVVAPADWVLRQDHPKHGLVWELDPRNVDATAVARLLLEGTEDSKTLSPLSSNKRLTWSG